MQGFTHVLGKAKLLIPAFKVEGFTEMVAVFESLCSLCTCRELSKKWPETFFWSNAIYGTELLGVFCFETTVRWHQRVLHGNDSRIIWLKALMIKHLRNVETTAFFIHLVFLLLGGYVLQNVPMILFISI